MAVVREGKAALSDMKQWRAVAHVRRPAGPAPAALSARRAGGGAVPQRLAAGCLLLQACPVDGVETPPRPAQRQCTFARSGPLLPAGLDPYVALAAPSRERVAKERSRRCCPHLRPAARSPAAGCRPPACPDPVAYGFSSRSSLRPAQRRGCRSGATSPETSTAPSRMAPIA